MVREHGCCADESHHRLVIAGPGAMRIARDGSDSVDQRSALTSLNSEAVSPSGTKHVVMADVTNLDEGFLPPSARHSTISPHEHNASRMHPVLAPECKQVRVMPK